jgi:prolyl 4-hydroxylase
MPNVGSSSQGIGSPEYLKLFVLALCLLFCVSVFGGRRRTRVLSERGAHREYCIDIGAAISIVSEDPVVRIIEDFATADLCDALIASYSPLLAPSTVVDKTSGSVLDPGRTSQTAYLPPGDEAEHAEIATVERRAMQLLGVPLRLLELLQMVRYEPGQEYRPHLDYFQKDEGGDKDNRTYTLFLYLNDMKSDETGGHTVFPALKLDVFPRKGRAVVWTNCAGDGLEFACDQRLLHGGSPPVASVKFGVNVWARSARAR